MGALAIGVVTIAMLTGAGDDFNDVTVGQAPPGWTVDTSGGTVAAAAAPDATDRSLQLTKPATTGVVRATKPLAALAGAVTVEARVRGTGTGGWLHALGVDGAAGPVADIGLRAGQLYDGGSGQSLGPVADGSWYVVRLELRTAEQRYDLYVDGERRLAGAAFATAATALTSLSARIDAGYQGGINLDNVAARQAPADSVSYLVADQFNDAPLGAAPPGYQATPGPGTVAVAAVPSAADRSLRIAKTVATGSSNAVRTFPAQTATVLVRANLRTDETTGTKVALYLQSSTGKTAISLRFVNAELQYFDGVTAHPLTAVTAREWYTVQLAVDVAAQKFEAFVDGRRVQPAPTGLGTTPRWSFRDPAATDVASALIGVGESQTGTVLVDNLLVYPHRPSAPAGTVIDVRNPPYGAVPNDTTPDTAAIQHAIDDAPPGARIVLNGGVFLTGTLRLKSDMTLWISRGSTLRGVQDDAAYPIYDRAALGAPNWGLSQFRALLFTLDADNVHVDGGGTIDGNGDKPEWRIEGNGPDPNNPVRRPLLFLPMRGHNVSLRNVSVQNAATWAVVPVQVDGFLVADVNLDSNLTYNRDGIDVCDSDNVVVERTSIWTDDDSIVMKSYDPVGVDDVTVRLSTVGHSERANGVKLGTESMGAFRGVTVEDVLVKHTLRSALTVTVVGGATARGLTFRRITAQDAYRAFFVLLGERTDGKTPLAEPRWVSGVRLEDVTGTGLREPSVASGETIGGHPYRVYDLLVSALHQELPGGAAAQPAAPAEYTGNYPESSMWPALPGSGLYVRHASGVTVRDATATLAAPDVRPAAVYADALDVRTP
ncbi:hypothetical protein GCM10010170_110130 [Dactylosporangium salmoneum]|uniref:Glycosyl hydrolase family 28 n=2 Tax=Dactylosporangium salmoneum TaxID=53361 RepID=A0ABP5V6P9_9ACTN